jgi:transposase
VHSRYVRRVTDLPWHGVRFRLQLSARRFFCDQPNCLRRIFTERLPGVVAPYARRTARLEEWLRALGFALGGEAGARLMRALGLLGSPDTLLRQIRRTPLPARPAPRVVSVDDWCRRRGHSYGALLVDLERRRIVDLLPDRESDTFATWLQAQPQVVVVSRDRGANFADGATRGAPQALQVADRFHILKNLVEALQQVVGREHALVQVAAQAAQASGGLPLQRRRGDTAPRERARAEAHARRQLRYDACRRLHTQGKRVREIASELHIGPNTVRRFLRAESCPPRAAAAAHRTRLTPFEPYLRERWDAGEQNGRRLFAEIRARGYRGSRSNLYTFLALWRPGPRRPGPYPRQERVTPAPPPPPRLTPRAVGWLLVRTERDDTPQAATFVGEIFRHSPTLAATAGAVRRFFTLLRQRQADHLEAWLHEAKTSGIPELVAFAQGVRRDLGAIQAAFTSPWSQGQTEGHVTRLKLLKRQMYGRANFDLLRQRVLYRPVG